MPHDDTHCCDAPIYATCHVLDRFRSDMVRRAGCAGGRCQAGRGTRGGDVLRNTGSTRVVAHCFECHGAKKQESGLRLDSRAGILRGGEGGRRVVEPGRPETSPLVEAIAYQGDIQMPPDGRLNDRQVHDLTEWVRPLVLLAKNTGLRKANVVNLKWSEVNLKDKLIILDAEVMKNARSEEHTSELQSH